MPKDNKTSHYPVMLNTVIKNWIVKKDGFYIDCTFGAGGHTKHLLECLSKSAQVIGVDLDEGSKNLGEELEKSDSRFSFVQLNFADFCDYWKQANLPKVHGIFFDLGYSTIQLQDENRGFSYNYSGKLDMTIDANNKKNATFILNTYSKKDLFYIFKTFGEFKNPRKLVDIIGEYRRVRDIETTEDFDNIINIAFPVNQYKFNKNPKKQLFQALRIEANNELENLTAALSYLDTILLPGGVALFLTFNSLEEKIIKDWTIKNCNIIQIPDYAHNMTNKFKTLNSQGFLPTQKEIYENWASRSAKLWVFEKLSLKSDKN